ncbi:Dihydrodiol dehydrogenase 3 [Camelus dromedarius]|uniref:Dihydrodiol dehydrogenase 3 n=1 Tax=Camelus dromedarius TaxID=9838 RepID=A0A5N4C5I1_CAMDR|nr:Dihydrodiol dehydrogenase 3 [Camelus dromedarius]KAB1254141.1 Dihydrodiol dehydrogenase 3 [Camelus dromedarius]
MDPNISVGNLMTAASFLCWDLAPMHLRRQFKKFFPVPRKIREMFEIRVLKMRFLERSSGGHQIRYRCWVPHIDCAYVYQNEEQVGQAIRRKCRRHCEERRILHSRCRVGLCLCVCPCRVNRIVHSAMIIWSQCWFVLLWAIPSTRVGATSVGKLTENLQLDYVDLYIITSHGYEGIFNKLMELKDLLETMEVTKLHPCPVGCLASGMSPYLKPEQLTDSAVQGNRYFWLPTVLGIPQRTKCCGFRHEGGPKPPVLLDDPLLGAIAKKHKQTPAVSPSYQLQRGVVVLAKSSYNIEADQGEHAGDCVGVQVLTGPIRSKSSPGEEFNVSFPFFQVFDFELTQKT